MMIDLADGLGRTRLHLACQDDDPEPVQRLLAQGARPDRADTGGRTPVHMAIEYGNAAVLRVLLEKGIDLSYRIPSLGATYLHVAANRLFALSGMDGDHAAEKERVRAVARVLAEAGAPLNEKDAAGWTPLWYLLAAGEAALLEELIGRGMDPTIPNPNGATPLEAERAEPGPCLAVLERCTRPG